jgi:hypothetical protein
VFFGVLALCCSRSFVLLVPNSVCGCIKPLKRVVAPIWVSCLNFGTGVC